MASATTATCVACEQEKPLAAFRVWGRGRSRRCGECVAASAGQLAERIRRAALAAGVFRCRSCGRELPLAAFRQPTGGLWRRCADCRAARSRAATRRGPGAHARVARGQRLAELRAYGFAIGEPS